MKLRQALHNHLPWGIIAVCLLEVLLTWSDFREAFSWIIASIGWLAYKIET